MEFDKSKIKILPLSQRENKSSLEVMIAPNSNPKRSSNLEKITNIAREILNARNDNKQIILFFGAHLIKNGLSLILNQMIEKGYLTHLATNGAGSIHDWEFAYQGKTEEDVREYVKKGQFGLWDETGKYQNLAIISGALRNKGYGESIGEMIHNDRLYIPSLFSYDIIDKLDEYDISLNRDLILKHPFKEYSVQASAYNKKIPFTIHPSLGQDIIYAHPLCNFEATGKVSGIDFYKFVNSVSKLEGGVYLSVSSSIASPMVFEKALSMSRNVALQKNKKIDDFLIVINDIQGVGEWDWKSEKEPPKEHPSYYLRFCKTFHRMGAREMIYIQEDNKIFLTNLYHELKKIAR